MPLTPQEELELQQLEALEKQSSTPSMGLTPAEEQELSQLEALEQQQPSSLGMAPATKPLGWMTREMEAGGKVDVISTGKGDFGGKSYGPYQLASKTGTLQKFVSSYPEFKNLKPGSTEFDAKFKELSTRDDFVKAQEEFIKNQNFAPLENELQSKGLNVKDRGEAVQELMFSIANQYGPKSGKALIEKAFKNVNANSLSDAEFIQQLNNYRIESIPKYFKSSSKDVQKGVQKRFEREGKILVPAVMSQAMESTTMELPTNIDIAAIEAARKEQFPSGSEQLRALQEQSERFKQAFVAGQASLPLGILQAQEQFQQSIPAVKAMEQMGMEVPSLRQELAGVLPTPLAETVTFEPKGLAEAGVMVGGGLLALEEPALQAAAKLGKSAAKLQEKAVAYDDAAGALFKRGAFGKAQARFEQPAFQPILMNAGEVKKAKNLETTLSRQERALRSLETQQQTLQEISNKTPEDLDAIARLKKKTDRINKKYFNTIREGQEIIESAPFKILKENQEQLSKQTVAVNNKTAPAFAQTISNKGVYVAPETINTLLNQTQRLDEPGIAGAINRVSAGPLSTVDHARLVQQADGNRLQGPLYKLLIEPAEIAKRDRQVWLNDQVAAFRAKAQELKLENLSAARNETLFDVADGVIAREAADLTPQENDLLNFMAKNYSDFIDQVNSIRAERGMDLVKKRANYITHITDMSLFDELGFGLDSFVADAKLNKIKRSEKAKFAFEKARTGAKTRKNIFEAYERYVNSVSKQIHYTNPAAVMQAHTDILTDPVLKSSQQRFINEAFLDQLDFKDDVLVQLGMRGPLDLAAKLSSNFTSAAILGNLNVLLTQFSQVPATVKETGLWPTFIGLYRATKPLPKQVADASSFLTLRQISDEVVPLNSRILNKPREFILKGLEFTDKFVARASWEAGFVNAKRRGFSNEAAIKYADEIGRMLHANYGSIYKPALLRGKTGRALLPLQSFFFNAWNYISRDQKALAELKNTTRFRETMKTLGAIAAANQLYDMMGLPAPFAFEAPEELSPEELLRVAKNATVGNVPLARILVEGVRPPAHRILTTELGLDKKSLLRNSYTALFSEDPVQQEEAQKALGKGALQFSPGGMQIKKTWEGKEAARDGYVNLGREIIPLTEEDRKLAPALGKYQVPSVRKARREMERKRIKRQLEGR